MTPMKWLAVALVLLAAAPALAEKKLHYFGRDDSTGTATIDHGQGRKAAREGDEVPGWGRIKSIEEHRMVVLRLLSEEERAALLARGAIPVAAEELIVHRRDLKVQPAR